MSAVLLAPEPLSNPMSLQWTLIIRVSYLLIPLLLVDRIDPDTNTPGPIRRSGRTCKPSRTILEEQKIQREVANTNTEQKARQIRRLEAAELIKEFFLKYGS